MITHIRMKNFKSWKDSDKVKLAPLTGFFGTNSSGKSSLLQMLLLLKQTAERADPEEVIFWGDEKSYVNLGNYLEVIHGHDKEQYLELEFGCKLISPFKIEYYPIHQNEYVIVPIEQFKYTLSLHDRNGYMGVDKFLYSVESCNLKEVKCEKGYLSYTDLSDSRKLIQLSKYNCYGKSTTGNNFITPFVLAFEKFFSHVFYLGPNRINPQRLYHWEGIHPKGIDLWGGSAIDSLLSAGVRKLKSSNKEGAVLIEDRISEWLQKMELAHSFRVIPTESLDDQNYEVRIRKSPSSAEVTLADMGYGLADVLPMLVYCYYVPEGSTLILEQPGVHLHPKVQSELADLFIEVVNERNLQILVESHSEHLLTRLQRRIAEKQIDQNNVALYFCRNNEGVSTIEKLDVDESGDIKNWPENFFGDVMGDMFAMTDKQVENIAEKGTED